jgi:hypothetical protein
LARRAGDDETAELARSIREQRQDMFVGLQAQLPTLTDAVVASEVAVDVNHRNVRMLEATERKRR